MTDGGGAYVLDIKLCLSFFPVTLCIPVSCASNIMYICALPT